MTKRVSAAQAKANLSELMSHVAYGGERVIIERRGKPMAVLIGVAELERLDRDKAVNEHPFPELIGALGTDEEVDRFIEDIYRSREQDIPRPVPPMFDDPDE